MAISRMNMERQLRAGGGIMTLEEPRQGYFLGKIVKKAKRAVKKVIKSPLGKAALLGGAAYLTGGFMPGGGGLKGGFANFRNLGSGIAGLFDKGKFLAPLVRADGGAGALSAGKLGLLGLGGAAIAAPFLMGGDDEEEAPDTSFTETPASIANIVEQAKNRDPSLRYLPEPQFVRNFYAADGGLANIPREGYKFGEMVEGLSMLTPVGAGMAAGKKVAESIKDDESMDMAGIGNVMRLFTNERTGFDRAGFEDMLIQYEDSNAKKRGVKLMDFALDFLGISSMKEGGLADIPREGYDNGGITLASNMENDRTLENLFEKYLDMGMSSREAEEAARKEFERMTKGIKALNKKRATAAEGGLMDLGGMEKDYRTGGFVDLGAKERADDVPARLSKNEFVFTADAVRNAGQGDIDKGAEVMQNMMDNLEAGGTISEESQGMENPAQAMFDQAQMLEGRLA